MTRISLGGVKGRGEEEGEKGEKGEEKGEGKEEGESTYSYREGISVLQLVQERGVRALLESFRGTIRLFVHPK